MSGRYRAACDVLKKLRDTSSTAMQPRSGRQSARTDENVDAVNALFLSQKSAPKMHQTTRQIARDTIIHQLSFALFIKIFNSNV